MRRQDEAAHVSTYARPQVNAFDATLDAAAGGSHSRAHPSLVALAQALGRGAAEADIARQSPTLSGAPA